MLDEYNNSRPQERFRSRTLTELSKNITREQQINQLGMQLSKV